MSAPTGKHRRVVVDLDDGLGADLLRLEELLLTLVRREDEAAAPGGDGWRPPAPLAGRQGLHALHRLQDVLRPTQTRTEYDPVLRQRREVPPTGPRWYAPDGRYELGALSFVDVEAADVALLAAVAVELGRPGGDEGVAEAIELHEHDDLPAGGTVRERERRGLVVTAARVAGLLDLAPTVDTVILEDAWSAAGGVDALRVVLTVEAEAAYHRTVDRLTTIATLSDPLARWAIGTPEHH